MNQYQSIPELIKRPLGSVSATHSYNTYRSIWISDFHLGTKGCKAAALVSFLRSMEAENLYLVGDIVDGWSLGPSWHWNAAQNDVVSEVGSWRRRGARVIHVPGNHDEISLIESLLGISPYCGDLVHVTANGCRLLVKHGHEYDSSLSSARWLCLMGGKAYAAALRINEWYCRERFARASRSLSGYWKAPVRGAVRYLTAVEMDENALLESARAHKVDGVVCGHTHRAEQRLIGPIWYINDGDWVENCTALAERLDGTLTLIRWKHDESSTNSTSLSNEKGNPDASEDQID
jgi:UDP-2,3-diacylglucosamine pyrophosphatase LpxH